MLIEQRQAERKILKTKALLTPEGGAAIQARTGDIGASGMSGSLPVPMKIGDPAQIRFDLFYEGTATPVVARTKASYCIYSNGEFKIGLQFLNLDIKAMAVLAKYLR